MTTPGAAMAAEIAETPSVVGRTFESVAGLTSTLVPVLRRARGVMLTARGSSDHAATYGRYVLEQALGVPVWSSAPSLVTRYGASIDLTGVLAIAISQSGETPEIVTVTDHAKSNGATAVAITNDPDSTLAHHADIVVPLRAGPETAVPSTKTFTASVAAFAAMAALVAGDRLPLDPGRVGDALSAATAGAAAVEPAIEVLTDASVAVHIARGYLFPLAHETALKLIECAGTAQLAWSSADFRHGPLAMIGGRHPFVIQSAPGPVAADTIELAGELVDAGTTLIAIGQEISGCVAHVGVPGDLPEHLRPLVHAVRAQQLALGVARARGLDPDHPTGLNKVTRTR